MTDQTTIDDFPHKVFAGNLSFKTTDDELKDFFSPAGAVTKVNIITRGTRSLGYGFVAFATPDECQAAVDKCHKQELGGREINVEIAKPKSELDAAKKEKKKSDKPRKRKPKKAKEDGDAKKEDGDAAKGGDGEKKKKRKPKKKAPRDPDAPKPEPKPRRAPTGDPSKTTVFVANLPFAIDDEGLAAVFAGFTLKSAKVVTRRGTGRSKGFGFVELESESEQQRLLAAPVFTSEGRELNIKIALSDEKPEETKA